MLTAVLVGFLAAACLPALHRAFGERATLLAALVPFGLAAWFAAQAGLVTAGHPLVATTPWLAGLDLHLAFRLDGLALLFALLISGIGGFVVLYTHGYLHGHPHQHRFVLYTLLFMASMLGVVLADNILLLFVFWELTSFTSYLLIGFNHHDEASRKAALQALLVTGLGGLFLLAGLLLLGDAAGTYSLSGLIAARDTLTAHPRYPVMLGLVLVGAFTKSAQTPFHFWLPNAMQAPTPASAYLHSSTMVKAGVYLLARLHPALGGTESWTLWVTGIGALTLLTGAVMATGQVYLKRLLAYTTVAALGAMVMALGLGTDRAVAAAMVFLLAHAGYKAALFLVAGMIDHATGEKDVTRLGGLARAMPLTAAAALVAAVSMAGLPPAFGFVGKELLYAALLPTPLLLAAAVAASACFVLVAWRTGLRPFLGARRATPLTPHEPPWTMLAGPLTLAAATLTAGLVPGALDALAGSAADAVRGAPLHLHLHLWHGWTPELAASGLTLLLGAILIALAPAAVTLGRALRGLATTLGPDRGYARTLGAVTGFAAGQTRALQSGSLRRYLVIAVLTVSALFVLSFARHTPPLTFLGPTPLSLPVALLGGLIIIATIAATLSTSRLGAVAAMGVVGFSVAVLFILFGAPDLAMTQLVVETLSVVLLVSAFYFLPPFARRSTWRGRARDLTVSVFAGVVMTLLVLLATGVQVHAPISGYFAETSVPLGHGRNIVNVILVDYRALDTLGEITVLAVAGLGSLALLRLRAANRRPRP